MMLLMIILVVLPFFSILFFIGMLVNYFRHGWFIYTRKRFKKLKDKLFLNNALTLPITEVYSWCLPLHKYSFLRNVRGKVLISKLGIYISPSVSFFSQTSFRFRDGLTILHKNDKIDTHLCYRFIRVNKAVLKNSILSIHPLCSWKWTEPLLEIHQIPEEYEDQINRLIKYFNDN